MGQFGTTTGQIDTLVLGCTHYPYFREHLRLMVGPEVQFIDNGKAMACQTQRRLSKLLTATNAPPGQVSLFATSQPHALQVAAQRWLALVVAS